VAARRWKERKSSNLRGKKLLLWVHFVWFRISSLGKFLIQLNIAWDRGYMTVIHYQNPYDSQVYTTPVSWGPLRPFFGLFKFDKFGRIPRLFGGGCCTGWACVDIGWDSTETSVNLISTLCCGSWVTLSVCGGGPFAKLSFARFRKYPSKRATFYRQLHSMTKNTRVLHLCIHCH